MTCIIIIMLYYFVCIMYYNNLVLMLTKSSISASIESSDLNYVLLQHTMYMCAHNYVDII